MMTGTTSGHLFRILQGMEECLCDMNRLAIDNGIEKALCRPRTDCTAEYLLSELEGSTGEVFLHFKSVIRERMPLTDDTRIADLLDAFLASCDRVWNVFEAAVREEIAATHDSSRDVSVTIMRVRGEKNED